MNNVYLQERLVELKLREVERQLEQARLLKEARLSGPSLLARVAQALRHLPKTRSKKLQRQHSAEPSA